jgi:hypothetical protein
MRAADRRTHLQHAEREWHHQSSSPVRAVYWPLRYTPPPSAPRCARALVGFAVAIVAPIALVLLHKAGWIDRPHASVLLFVAVVIGLYLACTATE